MLLFVRIQILITRMTGHIYQTILVRIFIVLATPSKEYKRIPRNSGGMNGTQLLMIINGGYHPHSTLGLFLIASIWSVKRKDIVHREANVCITFRGWMYYIMKLLSQPNLTKFCKNILGLRRFICLTKWQQPFPRGKKNFLKYI